MSLIYTISFIVLLMLIAYASLMRKKKFVDKPTERMPRNPTAIEHSPAEKPVDRAA